MESTAIIILAAGESSRMKKPKQLLKINGENLLDIVIKKAIHIQKENNFCVLGANSEKIQQELRCNTIKFIENSEFKKGLSSSIKCAINFIHKENKNIKKVLFILGDQPEISVNYLESLIQLSTKNPDKIVATKYKNNFGVPAVFPKFFFNELLKIEGDKGAKELLIKLNEFIILPNLAANFMDLDTLDDYELYLKSIKK